MSLKQLHEEFIDKARRPMSFGRLPVAAKEIDAPVVPVNRWTKQNNSLKKTYSFRLGSERNNFLQQLLEHEEEIGHHTVLAVKKEEVTVTLQTADIEQVTELDKEFATWIDELYRDVVYSLKHE